MCQYLLATMMVLEFPPRLSLRSHVNTESLYGMKTIDLRLLAVVIGLPTMDDISAGTTTKIHSVLKTVCTLIKGLHIIG